MDNDAWNSNKVIGSGNNGSWIPTIGSQIPEINDTGSQILDNEAWNANEEFGSSNNGSWIPAIGSQIPENGFGIDDDGASWIGSALSLGGFLGGLTAG